MSSSSEPNCFTSVFEQTFDVAVFGAGFVGFGAALSLAATGLRVIIVEPSGDLLWEATRALENRASASSPSPAWNDWLEAFCTPTGKIGECFDPALAEVAAASRLHGASPHISTLLYATPVQVARSGDAIASVTVATKSGLRPITALQWVDATECGLLARLCFGRGRGAERLPARRYRSLVLQSSAMRSVREAVAVTALAERYAELVLLPSIRGEEGRLRWRCGEKGWHHEIVALVRDLRGQLAGEKGGDFFVSHCATQEFPVYEGAAPISARGAAPENLKLLSPAWCSEELETVADRYMLGFRGGEQLSARCERNRCLPPAVLAEQSLGDPGSEAPVEQYDVIVAGAGTAGAAAAIAAARNGARTLVIEAALFPGGIGTGGGITGYFHGVAGGLQDEIDERAREVTELLTGKPGGQRWHHDAKKIALFELFEESGVVFNGASVLCSVTSDGEGRVHAVSAAGKEGLNALAAKAYIDATGDGDLCALAGAHSTFGREGDGRTLAYSQVAFSLVKGEGGYSIKGFNFDAGWGDATDPDDLTRARLSGLAQYRAWDWRGATPLLALAPQLGLRQSRQITTDAAISIDDMLTGRRFSDAIGIVKTLADTHSVDYEFESDSLAFYYWSCRGFRQILSCELPYGMLLPVGLANVWIACRAAGMDHDASYGLRMQREMQRLGEAAGVAAAESAKAGCSSRDVDLGIVQETLKRSGALSARAEIASAGLKQEWLCALDEGRPGIHLWHLWRDWASCGAEVQKRLSCSESRVSFYAAAVCAMAGEKGAEPRLLLALSGREVGPGPEEFRVLGPHGQCIDIPFWLQAVVLLRRMGSHEALPPLHQLASEPRLPFNVRTIVALTLERLAERLGALPQLVDAVRLIGAIEPAERSIAQLPPSHSLWRTLQGEPQRPMRNEQGLDTREDQAWQLELVVARIWRTLNRAPAQAAYRDDPRGFVRRSFRHKPVA